MRAFIAVELSKEIKETLARIQQKLSPFRQSLNIVNPENIHLTLRFLGEIDKGMVEEINTALQEAAKEYFQFSIALGNIAAFPKIEYPRVIWAGITKGNAELLNIAAAIEEKLVHIGLPKEDKPFSAHITIARVKSSHDRAQLVAALKAIPPLAQQETLINKFIFFKSTLTPHGAVHEIVKDYYLGTVLPPSIRLSENGP